MLVEFQAKIISILQPTTSRAGSPQEDFQEVRMFQLLARIILIPQATTNKVVSLLEDSHLQKITLEEIKMCQPPTKIIWIHQTTTWKVGSLQEIKTFQLLIITITNKVDFLPRTISLVEIALIKVLLTRISRTKDMENYLAIIILITLRVLFTILFKETITTTTTHLIKQMMMAWFQLIIIGNSHKIVMMINFWVKHLTWVDLLRERSNSNSSSNRISHNR